MSEELKERLEHILGMCTGRHTCWWDQKRKELSMGEVYEYSKDLQFASEQLGALLELFESYVLEIVGEDEKYLTRNFPQSTKFLKNAGIAIRNELRAEQRSRLESQETEGV